MKGIMFALRLITKIVILPVAVTCYLIYVAFLLLQKMGSVVVALLNLLLLLGVFACLFHYEAGTAKAIFILFGIEVIVVGLVSLLGTAFQSASAALLRQVWSK